MSSSLQGANATSNGAMALLQKFAALNNHIEEIRQQRNSVLREIDSVQQQLVDVGEDREKMCEKTDEAGKSLIQLEQRTKDALDSQLQVEKGHSEALLTNQVCARRLEAARQDTLESQQAFLERTRNFRHSCRRLQIRAQHMGIQHASLRAWIAAKGETISGTDLVGDQRHQTYGSRYRNSKFDIRDPDSWGLEVVQGDEELHELFLKYESKKSDLDLAQKNREIARIAWQEQLTNADTRRDRRTRLEEQLRRIEGDNDALESQMRELEWQTARVRETATVPELLKSTVQLISRSTNSTKTQQSSAAVTPTTGCRSTTGLSSRVAFHRTNPYANTGKNQYKNRISSTDSNVISTPEIRLPALHSEASDFRDSVSASIGRRGRRLGGSEFGLSMEIVGEPSITSMNYKKATDTCFNDPHISLPADDSLKRTIASLQDSDGEDFSYMPFTKKSNQPL
jgi:hypothetical protein